MKRNQRLGYKGQSIRGLKWNIQGSKDLIETRLKNLIDIFWNWCMARPHPCKARPRHIYCLSILSETESKTKRRVNMARSRPSEKIRRGRAKFSMPVRHELPSLPEPRAQPCHMVRILHEFWAEFQSNFGQSFTFLWSDLVDPRFP